MNLDVVGERRLLLLLLLGSSLCARGPFGGWILKLEEERPVDNDAEGGGE